MVNINRMNNHLFPLIEHKNTEYIMLSAIDTVSNENGFLTILLANKAIALQLTVFLIDV